MESVLGFRYVISGTGLGQAGTTAVRSLGATRNIAMLEEVERQQQVPDQMLSPTFSMLFVPGMYLFVFDFAFDLGARSTAFPCCFSAICTKKQLFLLHFVLRFSARSNALRTVCSCAKSIANSTLL
eukprot:564475-Rhodomonas_salina.1